MSLTDLKTAIPLACSLTLYFYFKPAIQAEFAYLFFGVWIFCFVIDARITVRNSHLMNHERNLIFPFLYSRLGRKTSIIAQSLVESTFIVMIGFIFESDIKLVPVSVTFLIFGLAHLEAYLANRSAVRKICRF